MTAGAGGPIAKAEVELELDFDDLPAELREGLERRVRAAARVAERELDRVEAAAAAVGTQMQRTGQQAQTASARVRRSSRAATAELRRTARAAEEAGESLAGSGERAAAAVERVQEAARDAQEALFDIDSDGLVQVRRDVEAVQEALFDLDTVELERVETVADRAATTVRGRLLRALRDFRASLRESGGGPVSLGLGDLADAAEETEQATERAGRAIDRHARRMQLLVAAIAAAVTLAPVAASAIAGIGAAAILAVPAIGRVIKSQEELADLWGALSRDERIASAATEALTDRYQELAEAVRPDVLQAYNGVISETTRLLPRLEPLAREGAKALNNLLIDVGEGLDSPRALQALQTLEQGIVPAGEAVGEVLASAGAAVASFIETLVPLVPVGLGAVTMLLDLATALNDVAPGLVQAAVLAAALRGPIGAVTDFVGSGVQRWKDYGKAAKTASVGTKVLNAVVSAGPNIYLAAGAAVAVFALHLATAETAAEKAAQAINANSRAVGNNISGYERANEILRQQLQPSTDAIDKSFQNLRESASAANIELAAGALVNENLQDTYRAASTTIQANETAMRNVAEAADILASQYKITRAEAIQLANAAGVNLSRGVVQSGSLIASAADKIGQYRDAAQVAQSSTRVLDSLLSIMGNTALGLTDRVNALNQALNVTLNPATAFVDAGLRVRSAEDQLEKAVKKTNLSVTQRLQIANQAGMALSTFAQAEFAATQSTTRSQAAYRRTRSEIAQLVGESKLGRTLLKALDETFVGLSSSGAQAAGGVRKAGQAAKELGKATLDAQGGIQEAAEQAGALNTRAGVAAGNVEALATEADKAGGRAKDAAGKVDTLADKLNQLKPKEIDVKVDTAPANAELNAFISSNNNRVLNLQLRVSGNPQIPGGRTGGQVLDGKLVKLARGGSVRQPRGGGVLRGPGTTTSDSIPAVIRRGGFALLSDREFIVNARSTKKYLGILKAINADRFAGGGQVGAGVQAFASGGQVRRNSVAVRLDLNISASAAKTLQRRIQAINDRLGGSLTRSLVGTPSEISRTLRSLETQIKRTFSGIRTQVDNRLIRRLETFNKRLTQLAAQRDRLTDRLQEAQQVALSITERAAGAAALAGLPEEDTATPQALAAALRKRLAVLKSFRADIERLSQRGLEGGLLQQLAELGPEQGAELADRLADAPLAVIREISALQRGIDRTSQALGRETADSLFDAGRQASKGFLAGLKADRKDITALLTELAREVSKTIRKELKIKSPSRVLRQDARDAGAGLVAGLEDMIRPVQRASSRLVAPIQSAARTAAVRPARQAVRQAAAGPEQRGRARVEITNHFHQVMARAQDIIDATEGRLVAAIR